MYMVLQYREYTKAKELEELLKSGLYRFYISGTTMYDGRPVSVIDIKQEYIDVFFVRKPINDKLYRLIRLYVDLDNFAIVKSDYSMVANFVKSLKEEYQMQLLHDSIMTKSVKQYVLKDGQYYLNYASYFGKVHDQPGTNQRKHLYYNMVELLVNNIVVDKKSFDRIKRRDMLRKETALWDMEYTYNPDFWENYNIILDKPLDQKVKVDLEHDVSLEDQFKETGSVKSK